jgi:hypothetical protein
VDEASYGNSDALALRCAARNVGADLLLPSTTFIDGTSLVWNGCERAVAFNFGSMTSSVPQQGHISRFP